MFMTYIVKQQQIPKFMFSFITFMLEDEHRLSLGMLMHVKCIHELCHLLLHIPTYLHVLRCYLHVLWGFSKNPLSLVYNSAELETPVFGIFEFQGPYGRQTDLGFFWSSYFPRRHNMRRRSTGGGPRGPNEPRWRGPHPRTRHPNSFPPRASSASVLISN